MPSALGLLLTVLVTTSVVAWIGTEERKNPRVNPSDGSVELRHGRKFLIVSLGSTLTAVVGCLLVLSLGAVTGLANVLGLVAVLIAILLCGSWMVLDDLNTRVLLSSQGVKAITPLGGERHLKWTEINAVTYNPWAGWITLKGTGHPSIRVNRYLVGSDSLIKRLRDNVGISVFHGLAQVLAHVGQDAA